MLIKLVETFGHDVFDIFNKLTDREISLITTIECFFVTSFAFSGVTIMFIPFVADVFGYTASQSALLLTYIGVLAVVGSVGGVVGSEFPFDVGRAGRLGAAERALAAMGIAAVCPKSADPFGRCREAAEDQAHVAGDIGRPVRVDFLTAVLSSRTRDCGPPVRLGQLPPAESEKPDASEQGKVDCHFDQRDVNEPGGQEHIQKPSDAAIG